MTKHVNALQWTAKGYELPVFPAIIPAAVAAAGVEKVKVVIVGGGLTGLTLAADLATRGIDAVLLDDDNSVGVRGASSRGMVWAQKTIEIMDRLGIAQRILDKGVIWSVGKTLSGAEVVYAFNRAEDNASLQPPSSTCSNSISNGISSSASGSSAGSSCAGTTPSPRCIHRILRFVSMSKHPAVAMRSRPIG